MRKPSSGKSAILSKPFKEIYLPCGSETLFSQWLLSLDLF